MTSVSERGTRVSKAVYGSDYMVEVLRELGIKYIALNPGASYRGLHDSLVNFGSGGPDILMCAHEEFAVAMANGYFRATGDVMATGLHNVVGLQHAAMAIFNAWCDRSAILNLGGGGPQDATHRRSTDWVHTALVQGNAVRDFVKFDDQPYSVAASAESLLRAYRIATTEPKGPVYVCLDSDIQEERIETPLPLPDASLYRAPVPPAADPNALRQAAEWLVNAEWPVIVPGEVGLKHEALPYLRELAELLGAAVVDAGGPFNFPNRHPLDLTAAREEALKDADVVLALDVPSLGVPLGPSVREREPLKLAIPPHAKIIHITLLDMQEQSWVNDVMWLLPVALPIAGSAARALPDLVELCRAGIRDANRSHVIDQRRARIEEIHRKAAQRTE